MKVVALVLIGCLSGFALAGEIAITIDDAPRKDSQLFTAQQRSEQLLFKLNLAGVDEAMFFVIAGAINDNNQSIIKGYAKAGHILASHSYSHQSADSLSAQAFIEDIDKADEKLRSFNGFQPVFRFPMLHQGNTVEKRQTILDHLAQRNYSVGYVTVDNYDWFMDKLLQEALTTNKTVDFEKLKQVYVQVLWETIQFYDSLAQEVLGRSPKHVLLLHENDLAAMYVGDLVAYLKYQGWRVIPAAEAYGDEIANFRADNLLNNQGRIVAMAQAQGLPAARLRHQSENEIYLRNLFEREHVFRP